MGIEPEMRGRISTQQQRPWEEEVVICISFNVLPNKGCAGSVTVISSLPMSPSTGVLRRSCFAAARGAEQGHFESCFQRLGFLEACHDALPFGCV